MCQRHMSMNIQAAELLPIGRLFQLILTNLGGARGLLNFNDICGAGRLAGNGNGGDAALP